MSPTEPTLLDPAEPQLQTRHPPAEPAARQTRPVLHRLFLTLVLFVLLVAILTPIAFFAARHWLQTVTKDALPQIDGTLAVSGLTAPVTVARDAHGTPTIHAANLDDLVFAQGFVTAQDRLFQMDSLRRHAAGTLAEVLGPSLVAHDKLQRTLQLRAAADRAIAVLPAEQLHLLERYAAGVNALIAQQTAPDNHLPVEFRILRYQPATWTPRDSLLITLVMFQDLTTSYPSKIARETLTAQLRPDLDPTVRAQLLDDLYPVGSWRDHPPTDPPTDLTKEGAPIPDVPLDESQSSLHLPAFTFGLSLTTDHSTLVPGSNNWVISGAHTASGKPLLSNDMHLTMTVPGVWYSADLAADDAPTPFHAAGVTLPGVPLIVVGHNDHIAWGFTNTGADVQDVYRETIRNSGDQEEFLATAGAPEDANTWQPVLHLSEPIAVKGAKTIPFEVLATRHGDAITPILNPILTNPADTKGGTLALRWTIYDPSVVTLPTLAVDRAHDWPSFLDAFRDFGGPTQNVVYADDQGHIGFHVMGKIPLRGAPEANPAPASAALPGDVAAPRSPSLNTPNELRTQIDALTAANNQPPPPKTPQLSGPLSAVPLVPTAAREWSGYIPFAQLPSAYDPEDGVLASANARISPDDYAYPITLNWGAPYRQERIFRLLEHSHGLTPADMLHIQTDIVSDFDRVLAERLTYALDHVTADKSLTQSQLQTLHQAADILRTFDGRMSTNSPAAAILACVHANLWPQLLAPLTTTKSDPSTLYVWYSRDYALEQILTHQPPRWLPPSSPDWNHFLAASTLHALTDSHAPADLASWRYGSIHTVDVEHPIFAQSALLRRLFAHPTGTGDHPQSGDGTTIKQVGHTFGPSERFTADLAHLNDSTLNLPLGQSGNPLSPWFLDQFPAWLAGTTFPQQGSATHTLVLQPGDK